MIDLENRKFTVPEIRFLENQMSQEDLGKKLGLSQYQVWARETGKQKWLLEEVAKISEFSGIPLSRIKA
ncbi:MAG: helix-turn-helix transcriptional regulator [Eubacterium sp.]|nr:helix-turn-helix transcriptional regulator [Eubacterium sp.]MBQ9643636.1 helix-turn-helix transcriptional regulator [Lachnospiraceae bacterium]